MTPRPTSLAPWEAADRGRHRVLRRSGLSRTGRAFAPHRGRRPGRPGRRRRPRRGARARRPSHGAGRPARADARAGVPGRPRAPGLGRRRHAAVRPHRPLHRRAVPGADRGLRRGDLRPGVGSRVRVVDVRVPRWHPDRCRRRRRRRRPPGVPPQPGRPRRMGQQCRAAPGRHRPRHPRPARRSHRAGRRREPQRHPPRGRDGPRRPDRPRDDGRGAARGAAPGAGPSAFARDHGLAGRDHRGLRRRREPGDGVPDGRRVRTPHRAGGRCAVVGPQRRPRPGPRDHRPARAAVHATLPRDEREDHAGRGARELHRGDARPLLRRARPLHRQLRHLLRPGRDPDAGRRAARRRRLPAALPRHRRPGRARVPRRGRGGAARQRATRRPAPHRPHPGHPPRGPVPVPRARCRREHAGVLGGPGGADGGADHAVPR